MIRGTESTPAESTAPAERRSSPRRSNTPPGNRPAGPRPSTCQGRRLDRSERRLVRTQPSRPAPYQCHRAPPPPGNRAPPSLRRPLGPRPYRQSSLLAAADEMPILGAMSDNPSAREKGNRRSGALADLLRAAIVSQADVRGDLGRSRILRPKEAGAYLNIGLDMLWWWRRHGGGPDYYRIGDQNVVGYRAADLDRWLESRRVAGAPKRP